jgi:phage-related minor tail protein
MFQSPEGLTAALDTFAAKADRSRADVIRQAIAGYIKYDLKAEMASRPGRPTKYASPEARKQAQYARNKAKRDEANAVMTLLRSARKLDDMRALAASIGLKLDEV